MTTTQPRPENLLMLMEWLQLGNKFHIHKEFFMYLDIEDIAKTAFVSKHYLHKYLKFACFHFIGVNYDLLDCLRVNYETNKGGGRKPNAEILREAKFFYSEDQKNFNTLKNMHMHNKLLRKIICCFLEKHSL